MYDQATFAAGDRLTTLQEKFVQTLGPAINRFCGGRLNKAEMAQCLEEAARYSGCGRFAFANNYWMLPGRGDAGAFLLVRVRSDFSNVGSVVPMVDKYAKFSSLPVALDEIGRAHV